ncbi:MAG: hypothetical protein AAB971_04025 [Patescibacteria group bacterium]
MDYKNLLALAGVILTFVASLPYIKAIINKQIKPHLITWFIWTVLAATGCIIQIIGGGRYGAAVLGATAALNLIILGLCLRSPKDNITKFDFFVLGLAVAAFVMWRLTSSASLAAALVLFTMAMGYIPTFRKSINYPQDEKTSLYFWSGVKQIIGIVALASYNFLTLSFPIFLVAANFSLVALLIMRHKQLAASVTT